MMSGCNYKQMLERPWYQKLAINVVAMAIGAPLGLQSCAWVEAKMNPVVTDFAVTSMTQTPAGMTAAGTLTKAKACELVATNVYALRNGQRELIKTFGAKDFGGQMSMGKQAWGPYTIATPLAGTRQIEVIGTHRCAFGLQESVYGRVDVPLKNGDGQ
jgi:hypothetical protein